MSQAIAEILRRRIAGLSIVGKSAGLVRAVPIDVKGKTKRFPVACNVEDPLACSHADLTDLVPDNRYPSIVYFEDLGSRREPVNRIVGDRRIVRLRLVVWMDTTKLGDQCSTGDAFQAEVERYINADRYDLHPFLGLSHRVVSVVPKSAAIFSKYNYDEVNRQYLTPPFDYFALDIEATYFVAPGCSDDIIPEPWGCDTPTGGIVGPGTSPCKVVRVCGEPQEGQILVYREGQFVPVFIQDILPE